jgi:transposase-like protein
MNNVRTISAATRSERADQLCRETGCSLKAACAEVGVARSTVQRWRKRREAAKLKPPRPRRHVTTSRYIWDSPDGDFDAWDRPILPGWGPR